MADLTTGRMPASHWILDAIGVLLPGMVLGLIAAPKVWRMINPPAERASFQ